MASAWLLSFFGLFILQAHETKEEKKLLPQGFFALIFAWARLASVCAVVS